MMEGLKKMLTVHTKVDPGRAEYDLSKKPEKERWWKTMKMGMTKNSFNAWNDSIHLLVNETVRIQQRSHQY
ncbi:uncharacterized protein YALI1_A04781g [Yarrowia lipolytica]|uniref:Uncharacterized protein n=1 Tax=Yarrowia lipolytica TaxID=4952 RepID=A0A1D8N3N9_YARLL|nr:hypothetical protein YALI1_A04781g [Yarrowia lipolytica]